MCKRKWGNSLVINIIKQKIEMERALKNKYGYGVSKDSEIWTLNEEELFSTAPPDDIKSNEYIFRENTQV